MPGALYYPNWCLNDALALQWKKRLLDSVPDIFSRSRQRDKQKQDELTAHLYQQIGQLKVELDWLKKKSGFDT